MPSEFNDAYVKTLVESKSFRDQIARYMHTELTQPLQYEKSNYGVSKIVWKITSPELPRPFLVKELSYRDPLASRDGGADNLTLSIDEAMYEMATIKAIKKTPAQAKHFSKNIGLVAVTHPQLDEKERVIKKGAVMSIDKAKRLYDADEAGVSFFMAEEIAQGREPNEAEVLRAKQMREEGMITHPRIWLTVDTAQNDFFVREDGKFVFFDVGHFSELTLKERQLMDRFTQQDKQRK